MARSLVIYRGPSRYNSQPVRAVLVLKSKNSKTGDMAQLFVVPDNVAPHAAQATGDDASVCGECPLRPTLGGGCYVTTCQGPLSTWKATRYQPTAGAAEVAGALAGRSLRLGAYGDVAALPAWIAEWLYRAAGGRVTGYTHGHRVLGLAGVEHLRNKCMLSVESAEAAEAAHDQGWRTFRARPSGAPLSGSEIECPSDSRGTKCEDCLLCRGTTVRARSIAIQVHGTAARRALHVVQ
jgi:hypothetical protein